MRGIAIIAAIVVLGGVAIAMLLAFYTARVYIARPVLTLIDTVSAWRKGDSSARTGMKDADGGNLRCRADARCVYGRVGREPGGEK